MQSSIIWVFERNEGTIKIFSRAWISIWISCIYVCITCAWDVICETNTTTKTVHPQYIFLFCRQMKRATLNRGRLQSCVVESEAAHMLALSKQFKKLDDYNVTSPLSFGSPVSVPTRSPDRLVRQWCSLFCANISLTYKLLCTLPSPSVRLFKTWRFKVENKRIAWKARELFLAANERK